MVLKRWRRRARWCKGSEEARPLFVLWTVTLQLLLRVVHNRDVTVTSTVMIITRSSS
jgi:hypothetical protein